MPEVRIATTTFGRIIATAIQEVRVALANSEVRMALASSEIRVAVAGTLKDMIDLLGIFDNYFDNYFE